MASVLPSLPPEVFLQIAEALPAEDLKNLMSASKWHHALLAGYFQSIVQAKIGSLLPDPVYQTPS